MQANRKTASVVARQYIDLLSQKKARLEAWQKQTASGREKHARSAHSFYSANSLRKWELSQLQFDRGIGKLQSPQIKLSELFPHACAPHFRHLNFCRLDALSVATAASIVGLTNAGIA
jgi:hypothetical protein